MDKLAELVDKIRADGGEAVAFLDVTDPESVKSFVAQTVEALGEVELLVSSAGDMLPGQLHEVSTEAFAEQVQIHLVGANRLATAVLPAMVARRRGDLIFVGSDVGLRQRPHMGAYGAAKAGLAAMVTNLQMELEGTGVRASIVHPGPTLTGMGWRSCRPNKSAQCWRTGQSGGRPGTTTSCDPATWHALSRSSQKRRAGVSW